MRGTWKGLASLLLAAGLWCPSLHLCFAGDPEAFFSETRAGLEDRHLGIWTDPVRREREILALRRGEVGEWDFMWRSFTAWALANQALRDPSGARARLEVIDGILDDTLRLERERGFRHFLLPYGSSRPFVSKPEGSQFVDGEIALMIGLRRLVEEKASLKPLLAERMATIVRRMKEGAVSSAESYPDECWTFCNAVALAATRVADVLDGTDHGELRRAWVSAARRRLIEPKTGLLVSEYTLQGSPMDGPEGSTNWLVAHMLQVVDADFAREQYDRSKAGLVRTFLGFGFSREWPAGLETEHDIDAGAVVPLLEAGAGGSGLAFVGAAAFGDRDFLGRLLASLRCAGLPVRSGPELKFASSNLVGDAVLLYAGSLGPAWAEVERRSR